MRSIYHAPKNGEGFTLVELMIIVAVVAILAGVAIPAYLGSVRRSYLNEVNAGFAAIKNAEEGFMTANGCYVSAPAWPANIPLGGTPAVWDPTSWTGTAVAWSQSGLNVRPDRMVRFQYQVYASNAWAATGCGAVQAKSTIGADRGGGGATGTVGCVTNSLQLIPDSVFSTNWYILVARGNLNGDSVASNIISAIDDSTVIMCNELE
jgi:type II secretory pathway pseudopilin PulG